jgi:cell wall-associated NlpC family hydrolase
MKKYFFLVGLTITLIATSCTTSKKYGNNNDIYTRGRVANRKVPSGKVEETTKPNSKERKETQITKANTGRKAEISKREDIVSTAQQYVGVPYKYAGKSPSEGFDCSGFVNYVYNTLGLDLRGPSSELARLGEDKDQEDLQPGDLVFFGNEERVNHVGIVTQNDQGKTQFIHSATSKGIRQDELNTSDYWKGKYLFGKNVLSQMLKEL